MILRYIKSKWDKWTREDINYNFRTIANSIVNVKNEIKDEVYEALINSMKINWLESVDTYDDLAIKYPDALEGDASMTNDTGDVYRLDENGIWVNIMEIDAGPVNALETKLTNELDTKSSYKDTNYLSSEILVTGHRGYMSLAPENTLSAIKLCEAYGLDGFEIDIHELNTGELVVIHDSTVNRTTNSTGNVKDYTLEDLQSLDAGSWFNEKYRGEKIPTLEEVLKYSKGRFKRIYLEIKSVTNLEAVYNLVKEQGMLDVCSFHGFHGVFDFEVLRSLDKNIKLSVISTNLRNSLDYAISIDATEFCVDWGTLSSNIDIITEVKDNGLRVYTWGITRIDQIETALGLGVNSFNLDDAGLWIGGRK